jgi:hypothetical protein
MHVWGGAFQYMIICLQGGDEEYRRSINRAYRIVSTAATQCDKGYEKCKKKQLAGWLIKRIKTFLYADFVAELVHYCRDKDKYRRQFQEFPHMTSWILIFIDSIRTVVFRDDKNIATALDQIHGVLVTGNWGQCNADSSKWQDTHVWTDEDFKEMEQRIRNSFDRKFDFKAHSMLCAVGSERNTSDTACVFAESEVVESLIEVAVQMWRKGVVDVLPIEFMPSKHIMEHNCMNYCESIFTSPKYNAKWRIYGYLVRNRFEAVDGFEYIQKSRLQSSYRTLAQVRVFIKLHAYACFRISYVLRGVASCRDSVSSKQQ